MTLTARDLMETDVKTVAPDDDVADAFKQFARYPFSGFPVVDEDDRVVGVVTESDLVDLFEPKDETLWIPIGLPPFVDTLTYQVKAPWADLDLGVDMVRNADRPVSDVMSTDVTTVTPETDVDAVLDLLAGDAPDINRVPVVDEAGRVVGVIARQDVIRAFRDRRLE
jgi:CBS domain-containing protein